VWFHTAIDTRKLIRFVQPLIGVRDAEPRRLHKKLGVI
jgi:hypothetical protein